MLPQHTHDLVYAGGDWSLPGADDQPCEGARFHSPTPLFVTNVRLCPAEWLTSAGINPGVVTASAWLCGTCAANLAMLQQIIKAEKGQVPWQVRREFGNQLRGLAFQGWDAYRRVSAHAG